MPEGESQDASRSSATPPAPQNLLGRFTATVLLEYLLLFALVGLFIWRALIPAWSSLNTDFPNYYLTARLYRQGYPMERVYDWIWFQRQWDHTGFERRVVAYNPLMLFSALPDLPLTSLPPLEAKRCWLVVNLILLGLAAYLLNGITNLGGRRILILTFLATFPLRTNFLFGQQHLLVFFLLTLAAWFYFSQRPASSGAILALAAGLKIYPALFVFYFLRKRQWRALTGLVLGALGLAALSLWLFGYAANRAYVLEVLPRAMRGETVDPYNVHWQSVTALLHRLFISEPELNPQPLAHWPAAYSILQPLCQALLLVLSLWLIRSSRVDPVREKLEWGSYVVLLLILSPNPASYHFCALILPAVLATDYLLGRGLRAHIGALVILYGLASLSYARWMTTSPTGWTNFLAFPQLYALLIFAIFLAWLLSRGISPPSVSRLKSREAVVFGLILLGMVVAGTLSNLRHQEGQYVNYASRLTVAPGSLMATQPVTGGGTLVFTTLGPQGYGTSVLAGNKVTHLDFGADTFHPALAPNLTEGWVEIASPRSRIVRFPLSGSLPPVAQLPVEVEDAEQPVVSPDGRWLLFIREQLGRGSLWVKDLRAMEATALPSEPERRMVGAEYDVLDAAFTTDSRVVLFSAQREARPELFSLEVEGDPRVIPAGPDLGWPATRYPAFSPDGAWLAFSWYRRGTWQLCVTKVRSGTVNQLTSADCNSITPAWLPDSKTLVYATDCGRGLGMTTLAEITAAP